MQTFECNRLKIGGKKISFAWLWVVSCLLSTLCMWSYGNSYYIYVAVSVFQMVLVYGIFLRKLFINKSNLDLVFLIIILINFLFGVYSGEITSFLMVNTALLMATVLSEMEIDFTQNEKGAICSATVILLLSVLLTVNTQMFNSNSLSILIFCNGSIGFIWYKNAKTLLSRIFAILYFIALCSLLFATQTRNTALVIVFCLILLLIPGKVFRNKVFYRTLYIIAIATTVFAIPIMEFIFSNERVFGWLIDFTSNVSDKTYSMETHLDIILYVRGRFQELTLLERIFGQGVKTHHCHNLLYQCLFFYGYFGTIIIYGFFIYVFEIGFMLYAKRGDKLALSCCIILIGHFLMQCAEVYMYGLEMTIMVCFIPVAIILNLKKTSIVKAKRESNNKKLDAEEEKA